MITGAHVVLYSRDAKADRAFFRDVLNFPSMDAGAGWLIFALPPSEMAVHPAEDNGRHELYLMCDDIEAEMVRLADLKVACSPASDEGWGILTSVPLPGGGSVGLYQPQHKRPSRG